ncbi:MAG: hypothetical protein JF609_01495 [Verrucomicrobia bacterium]|nr:hypothetical protein [Verrucomicrobiota bacterium]
MRLGFFVCTLLPLATVAQIGGTGWKPVTVNFKIQSPTNASQSARYFVTNSPLSTYHCLTYSNDGAFSIGNTTLPRTEQRFNPDYTNGEIHYQAMFLCPSNENSYSIFQIHTGDAQSGTFGSTTFMAFWFTNNGGSVHDYSGTTLATNLGNKWFQLNFDHNVVTRTIRVWINRQLVWTQQDNGAGDFYIKDGVYEQSHNPTYQMDTYITNILEWTSSGTNPPAAPTGLAATPTSVSIPLTWGSSVGATNYNIKRSTTSGSGYATLSTLSGTNYADSSALVGTAYYYVVSALDEFGESSNSIQVAATIVNSNSPPIISHITRAGTNLIASGSSGLAGLNYYVLATTNLALSPGAWASVATNSFDGLGNFIFTNGFPPGSPQQFLRLRTP